MIGTLIGAGLKAAGSIYGGIQASRAAKKAKGIVEQQKEENQAWYDRRYNEDATQRADAQAVLTSIEESIKNRNRQAAGAAAVAGASQEAVAAQKAAGNDALAKATAGIVANGEAQKAAVENRYLGTQNALNGELANIEQQRAQQITAATEQAGAVGDNIAMLGGGEDDERKKSSTASMS